MKKAYERHSNMNWPAASRITAVIGRADVSFDFHDLKPATNNIAKNVDCTIKQSGYRRRLLIGT
ncbi:MAG: hypothetical protein IPJ07_05390 [Acidobacteria bacterium]|jgi:hypothetical protein|nr:hypothetical protein [Acidobacteriota bacterium]